MEAGKHVLSEIPSVNSLEEAYELKAVVTAHPDLIYMAAENCCYWAFIETWKKMHERGEFGDIVYAEAEYLHAKNPDEFAPPSMGRS
jgi:predicted dehydrogenase